MADSEQNEPDYEIGYCRPPVHSRFQPGVSGNPSGRPRGSQNFRTLLDRILNEEIPLLDGAQQRKVSKAEAITRRLVIGALKGDSRSLSTLFRLVAQTGEFEHERHDPIVIQRVIYDPCHSASAQSPALPANSEANREEA